MRENPWMVVDVMTNEIVDWCASRGEAEEKWDRKPVDISYKPGRKRKVVKK